MSVKRFVAADMRRALELVRQEMGPDAVILSSRRVKQGVEILTSLQPQSASVQRPVDKAVDGVDVPMSSDGAWRDQQIVDRAIHQNRSLQQGHLQAPAHPQRSNGGSAPTHSFAAQMEKTKVSANSTNSRGVASGKTQAELADEMEQARLKMLAAREQTTFEDTPISQLATNGQNRAPVDDYIAQARESEFSHAETLHTSPAQRPEPVASVRSGVENNVDSTQQVLAAHEQRLQQRYDGERREQQEQLHALQSELADMRLLLEEQLTRMANTPQMGTPVHSGLMRRLKHMGMTDGPAEQAVKAVKSLGTMQEAWADTLAKLSHQIPANSSDRIMAGGVFAFVGPTGVGKTTTIAKLAARYVLEHGSENVALVTTDTYRIAAHDQLRSLGRILNVQVKVVDDNQDLPAVLRSLKGCPLVLIDSAGFRHGDIQLKEQLAALTVAPQVEPILVLACNSQLQMMKATIHAHQSVQLQGCILTKLDEAASLGEAISVLIEHQLPVCYTTDGQEIPQDIQVAKGHKLVAKAVNLMRSGLGNHGEVDTNSVLNAR